MVYKYLSHIITTISVYNRFNCKKKLARVFYFIFKPNLDALLFYPWNILEVAEGGYS